MMLEEFRLTYDSLKFRHRPLQGSHFSMDKDQ